MILKYLKAATGMNFIYILKTPNSSTPSTTSKFCWKSSSNGSQYHGKT